jgi:predicted Holliday junction resolvase-like endonuclease
LDISLGAYLREQRHIFGICPHCGGLSRLTEVEISYRTKYVQDWLDKIMAKNQWWEERIADFQEKEEEIREEFRQRARTTVLPRKLKKISPLFAKHRLSAADVRVLSHPVDFVGFDGIAVGKLQRILLLDRQSKDKEHVSMQASIKNAVRDERYDFLVLKIDEEFRVTSE